jgi:ribosome-associated heat shock protein Hsp15
MALVRAAGEDPLARGEADRGRQGSRQRPADAEASRPLRLGDVVTGTAGRRLFVVRVTGAAEKRGPARGVAALYDDLTPAAPKPPPATVEVERGPRPTKRDRRKLDAFKAERT